MFTSFICYLKILSLYVLFNSCVAVNAVSEYESTPQVGSREASTERLEMSLQLIKPNENFTNTAQLPKCVQVQCKIVCTLGQSELLEKSIQNAVSANNTDCIIINELSLYNIEFPKRTITYSFLGKYFYRVRSLYIGSSNVTDIGSGAFGNGIFEQIYLENLQLGVLRKDILKNVNSIFENLTIIQRDKAVQYVYDDFLGHVKYQISKLTLQVGLPKVTNVTASSSLLNNLKYVDLSYNNFTDTLTDESFGKLWVVESLDLSHSNIQVLPDYIFSQLKDSLIYLNLSNNHLVTINHLIFGRHAINDDLIIDAHGNPWNCSCELRMEMSMIFIYQSNYPICKTPKKYEYLTVLDQSMCPDLFNRTKTTTSNKPSTRFTEPTNNWNPMTSVIEVYMTTPTPNQDANSSTTIPFTASPIPVAEAPFDVTIRLQCMSPGGKTIAGWRKVLWPDAQIRLTGLSHLRIAVSLQIENSGNSYGLMWFSKVEGDYYSMAVNYNQHGLGCIGPINNATNIIDDLIPNTSYTICLVEKDQLTVSPFNCKSLHLSSNLDINYNAWLTHDARPTGISLTILGVVLCCFVGNIAVYMLLKHKPTLLKGSKRVKVASTNSQDIVIFPKDRSLQDLRIKEQTLAKYQIRSASDATTVNNTVRRYSIFSVESNESYMNSNLYEVIPAYLRLQDIDRDNENESVKLECINSYMPPLAPKYIYDDTSLVSYAEVAPRSKRASNDPLPALPAKQIEPTLPSAEEIASSALNVADTADT